MSNLVVKTNEIAISDQKARILANLGQIIKNIQEDLPKNKNGLPNHYVDAQIILDWLTTNGQAVGELPDSIVNSSLVPIDYLEEVPVVNGLPVWERFDCEPMVEYKLFKLYRDSTNLDGVSQRSFENLSNSTEIKVKSLYAVSKVYHWQMRVRAFDLFKEATIEDEKKKLIRLMETKHRTSAVKIFDKCVTYFENLKDAQLEKVNPKDMIHCFSEASRLERLSLGLSADKPVTVEDRVKIDKIVSITQTDNKTLNIGDKDLQELVNILNVAGALPKGIVAKGDLQKELEKEVIVVDG